MSGLLYEIERERRLEKIRGKVRARKPSTLKYIKPVRLSNGLWLVPLEEQPEGHHEADKQPSFGERLPKRARATYLAGIALLSGMSRRYIGYLDATNPEGSPGWFWWRPGKRHASEVGDDLADAIDRVGVINLTDEDRKAIDKLEHAYRSANTPREGW